ncbi:signal recognition particle subunit SRP72-like [Dendronephthya gigantea]|uniref:signal recognition particle subunit SRP72-like n=1 Tax=Dendronephthya gigantea TaxID=151771 RepID=UPI00106C2BBC|nr:signal recognition particle subunit SRP72-like [Dendronephthya gigantea]
MAAASEVSQLFSDLEQCEKSGNYIKGLKIANKILEKVPNDKDAFQCKIVCFMQQGKFHDASQILKSSRVKKGISLPFEEAYCLYRLNKTTEALELLKAIADPSPREKELLAQVYYRLEEYKKCYELYTDLIKNSQDDFGDERETNLAAVVAASRSLGQTDVNCEGLREDTYELCYNAACLSIADGEMETAGRKLLTAEDLCKKSMEEEGDVTEEEIESELGVLRVQRGYTCQMLGKDDEAMKLYNQVLKSRPNDIAISAVASNNVVSLNKDRDIFDSKKKIKVATADGIETKLNDRQKQYIAFNKCLVLMYSNQSDACRKAAKELEAKYPESDFPVLIQAALLFREKQHQDAVNMLEKHVEVRARCSMQVSLAIVQLHLILGNSLEACKRLRSIETVKHRPAVVALLVNLYTHAGDIDAAVQVLDDAVAYAKTNKTVGDQEELVRLLRENVAYKLKRGKTKEAVAVLEYLHDLDPDDLKTIAHLVAAYSQIDPKKSEQYSMKLPPLEGDEVDVNALEVSLGTRYTRKTAKLISDGMKEKPKTEEKQDVVVKRRRKKKPGKLPKNYNPEVDPDPERWLPRRERSYFKGKRQKKATGAIGKGTQGATASQESPSAKAAPSPKTAASPPGTPGGSGSSTTGVVPPRQQQPQASKKKQRPKKKKGGW